jgi:hypothetical protein
MELDSKNQPEGSATEQKYNNGIIPQTDTSQNKPRMSV